MPTEALQSEVIGVEPFWPVRLLLWSVKCFVSAVTEVTLTPQTALLCRLHLHGIANKISIKLNDDRWARPADLLLPPSRAVLLHDDTAFEARCRQALLAAQMHEQQHPLSQEVRTAEPTRTNHVCNIADAVIPVA